MNPNRLYIVVALGLACIACRPTSKLYPTGTEYMIDLPDGAPARWRRQPSAPHYADLVMEPDRKDFDPEIVPEYDALWVHADTSVLFVRRIGRRPYEKVGDTVDDYARRLRQSYRVDTEGALAHGTLVRDFHSESGDPPMDAESPRDATIGRPQGEPVNAKAERFVLPRADSSKDRVTLIGVLPVRHPFLVVLFALVEPECADHHEDLYALLRHFALAP
jgi:hypothetical protein